MKPSLLPLALALLAALPVGAQSLRGTLPADQDVPVGDFVVRWSASGGGSLRVLDRAGRSLWETRPGEAFLRAEERKLTFRGQRGSFEPRSRRRARSRDQEIAALQASPTGAILTGLLRGRTSAPYVVEFRAASRTRLAIHARLSGATRYNALVLRYETTPEEEFLGFGEQFSHLGFKGKRVPVLVREQGVGRGRQPFTWLLNLFGGDAGGNALTTYAPAPYYLTTRLRGLFLENDELSEFDLRDARRVEVRVAGTELRAQVLSGRTPLDLISAYTEYAGRMRALPDWAHQGAVVGMVGGTAEVRRIQGELESRGAPVSAFFLQDWVGERRTPIGTRLWWNWEPDPGTYADWRGLVTGLRRDGYRVMSYVNPYLSDPAGKPGLSRNLFREAQSRDFLVRDPQGGVHLMDQAGFKAAIVDLSNPAARTWYAQVIRTQLLDSGVSGWMGDFGEALPFDARLNRGSAKTLHNRYPELWQQVQRRAVADAGLQNEVVFFSRSGFTRSPGITRLFWAGDQMTNWDRHDGIKSGLTGLLSGGISGMSLNHTDIGGYTTLKVGPFTLFARGAELLWRWMELAAFTPMYRTHDGLLPGVGEGFSTSPTNLNAFTRNAHLFAALFDYRKELMREAEQRGWPLLRQPWLHYPQHPELLRARWQFLLGADLLVAPVLDRGRREVEVLLPPGRWVSVWDGSEHGDALGTRRVRLPAPLGRPCALHRKGSLAGQRFAAELARRGLK